MTFWTVGAVVGSAVIGASASGKAAKSQAAAAGQAADFEREMFERNIELNAPFREAGVNALNKLIPLTDYKDFGMSEFLAGPGYSFRLS